MNKNYIEAGKAFVRRNAFKTAGLVGLASLSICAAFAEGGTTGVDYTTTINQFKTDFTSLLTTNGPALIGALVVALGFGVVWKLIKRASKNI
jgi:hypothetical protein